MDHAIANSIEELEETGQGMSIEFEELLEKGKGLVDYINSITVDKHLGLATKELHAFFDRTGETKKIVTQILQDVSQTEEIVGQKLLDMEEQKKKVNSELETLEEDLTQLTCTSQIAESELQFLQSELDSLRDGELELDALEQEVEEDTTEIIPSAVHHAKLYYKITNIKWEHDTEPHICKGVHFGPDLATPINIDTSEKSKTAVSDFLWDMVSTEWSVKGAGV